MGTLKGQNFRICIYDSDAEKYKVIGMATNCSVTLTNNVESSSTKDDVGLAEKPVTTSKSWQVSVDSLNVADTASMLSAIKAMEPFTLMWDETSTTDNQSRVKAAFARKGQAYLTDATFQFDNRTNAQKSLQFSGTGALSTVASSEAVEVISAGSYTKGQFVRLFITSDGISAPSYAIAAARTLQLHVSLTMEDATTKDTANGDWQVQEPTGISYDITSGALMRSGETITSQVGAKSLNDLESIYNNGTPINWQITNVSGDNNRTAGTQIVYGMAVLTQLQLTAQNRSAAEYQATLQGYGNYTVAAA